MRRWGCDPGDAIYGRGFFAFLFSLHLCFSLGEKKENGSMFHTPTEILFSKFSPWEDWEPRNAVRE